MAQNTPTEHCPHCRYKSSPRDPEILRQLNNRLKRINGQLAGISRMLEENRYCGDILLQVAAVENALQGFGYTLLQDHLETCVTEEVKNGNPQVMGEAMDLIKKLK
ncbi:MAG: metal-sensing transcriptional repressor [Clostridia bacterium]|nr:metal-sensing transcriptional repressor [Clostridia bacterium]